LSYHVLQVAERDKQRRPSAGPSYVADGPFRERLDALRQTRSTKTIVQEVAEVGYRLDSSMIRKLSTGAQKSGKAVGFICRRYDWPLPPQAHESGSGEVMSALKEIERRDPGEYARYRRMILRSVENLREFSELDRETPDENDD
jgi:hypothetical protein